MRHPKIPQRVHARYLTPSFPTKGGLALAAMVLQRGFQLKYYYVGFRV